MQPRVFLFGPTGGETCWSRTLVRSVCAPRMGDQSIESTMPAQTSPGRNEEFLEAIIAANPETLGFLEDDDSAIHGPFACFRQSPVRALNGRTIFPDIVILSQSGHVLIVEVKLFDNDELKDRRVIAQVLEYAAVLSTYDEDRLLQLLGGKELVDLSWSDWVGKLFPGAADPSRLAKRFLSEFRNARLSLVIACDQAPVGLRELVQNVVRQSALGDFKLRVVEIGVYTSESRPDEVLVLPETTVETEIVQRISVQVGYTTSTVGECPSVQVSTTPLEEAEARAKAARDRSSGRVWNESLFFERVGDQLDEGTALAIRQMYEGLKTRGYRITWGTGLTSGSYKAAHPEISESNVLSVDTDGRLWISFGNLEEPTAQRLRSSLAEAGFEFPEKLRFPSVKPDSWRERIMAVLDATDVVRKPAQP